MRETVSMKVWAAARSLSKSVLLLSAFLTVAGCANSGKGRVYLLPEQRLVSGIIQPGKDISLANLEVSLITPAGMRSTPTGLKLDSKNGNFSFTLPDSATVQSSDGGVIEQLLSMGGFLPDMVRPGSALVGQVLKYARFEIRSKNFEDKDYQKIPYAQLLLPLERRNTLSGTDALNFGSPLSISSAGFVKVTVRDLKSGVALPNVQIAAVSDGKTTANIPVWQAAQVRPIFSTTDANGVAIVGPIDASLELTRFKFLARASGYCTYLGDAKIFGLSRTDKHTVNLRPCDAQDTTISTLLPTFPTNLKYLKSVDTAKVTRDVLFTSSANDTTLKLRLDSTTGLFRKFTWEVFAATPTYTASSDKPEKTGTLDSFEGEFVIDMPYAITNYFIRITQLPGERDGTELNSDSFPPLTIYGNKNTSLPSVEFLKVSSPEPAQVYDGSFTKFEPATTDPNLPQLVNLSIVGDGGFDHVIPGKPGYKFKIKTTSKFCPEGYELGIAIKLSTKKTYSPCINGSAEFKVEDVFGVTNSSVKSEVKQAFFYLKDKWGNISNNETNVTSADYSAGVDSKSNLNIRNLIVDSDQPAATLLNLEFGEGSGYDFVSTDRIKKSELLDGTKAYAVRFEKTTAGTLAFAACSDLANAHGDANSIFDDIRDGSGKVFLLNSNRAFIGKDEFGRYILTSEMNNTLVAKRIVQFKLGSSSEAASGATFQNCILRAQSQNTEDLLDFTADTTNGIELKSTDVIFSTSTMTFYIVLKSAAGINSDPIKIEVHKCGGALSKKCWEE